MNSTGTHDISRIITILGVDDWSIISGGEWIWDLNKRIKDNLEFLRNFKMTKAQYLLGRARLMSYFTSLAFFPGNVTIFYGDEVGMTGLGNLMNRGSYPWGRRDKKILKHVRTVLGIKRKKSEYKKSKANILEVGEDYFMYERIISGKRLVVVSSRREFPVKIKDPYQGYKKQGLFKLGKNTSENRLDSFGAIVYEVKI